MSDWVDPVRTFHEDFREIGADQVNWRDNFPERKQTRVNQIGVDKFKLLLRLKHAWHHSLKNLYN